MTIGVTLLGRAIPDTMERAEHVLEPGRTIAVDDAWHQVLAVVEHGDIEIQTAFGGRVQLSRRVRRRRRHRSPWPRAGTERP